MAIAPTRARLEAQPRGKAVTVPGAFDQEHAWKQYGVGEATPVR